MQRASVSISSNIAEGCARSSQADFARLLEIALGSSYELHSQAILANQLAYLDKKTLDDFESQIVPLQKQISALIIKLRRN